MRTVVCEKAYCPRTYEERLLTHTAAQKSSVELRFLMKHRRGIEHEVRRLVEVDEHLVLCRIGFRRNLEPVERCCERRTSADLPSATPRQAVRSFELKKQREPGGFKLHVVPATGASLLDKRRKYRGGRQAAQSRHELVR